MPCRSAPADSAEPGTPSWRSRRVRPATPTLVASFDEHRYRSGGVEPICTVLTGNGCKIAPSTYYAHKKRLASPVARPVHDEELKERIQEIYTFNYRVYGARAS